MREYGRIFSCIWSSSDFRSLSEDGRNLVLYLLSSQHGTIAGVFRMPDGYACEDLQWSAARVSKGFQELLLNGFANRCETTKWVWVTKFLDWNPPENPNQRKAAAKVIASVPDQCCWKRAFMRVCGPRLGLEAPPDEEGSETVGEPFRNQEQEQEQEQEYLSDEANASSSSSGTTTAGAKSSIRCPYDAIVDAYHEALPGLPRVVLRDGKTWTKRQKAMRELWGWVLSSRRADGTRRAETADDALTWVRGYFERAAENDFIVGKSPPGPGHEGWRASLDYLLTERGLRQVVEHTKDAA
ncbi:MAG: hypothetical protein HY855_02850 [Burkholderiales bacterium]|nr:hypothetical protein [Burkholderiales bacterium]